MTEQLYTDDPDWGDVIELGARHVVAGVRTVIPGIIAAVNDDAGVIEVDVNFVIPDRIEDNALDDEDPDRVQFRLPAGVSRVPYLQLAAGGSTMGLALYPAVGDEVVLYVGDRSFDEWLESGVKNVNPVDPRRWDLDDVLALPSPTSIKQAVASARSGAAVLYGPEVRLGSPNASQAIPREDRIQAQLSSIASLLNLILTLLKAQGAAFAVPPVPAAPVTVIDAATATAYNTAMAAILAASQYTPGSTATDKIKGE